MSKSWICGLLIAVFLMMIPVYMGVSKDKRWARKVQKQFHPETTRTWALNALQYYLRTGDFSLHQTWLTNAPSVLTNSHNRRPYVLVEDEDERGTCLHLRYGGGVYDWGLTVGASNLPAFYARGKNHKTWAPGIYFWWN